jgi:hypothetical protein
MFNKSEIMRNAWSIKVTEKSWSFSDCLKKSWAQAKDNRPTATIAVPYGDWKTARVYDKLGAYEYNPSTKCVDIDLKDGVYMDEVSYGAYRDGRVRGDYVVSIANSYNSTTKTIKVLYI